VRRRGCGALPRARGPDPRMAAASVVRGRGFLLFGPPIGACGIAWGDQGVIGVQLPESSEAALRARLRRAVPDARETAPPPEVQRAIDAMTALLGGESSDLSFVELDMRHVPPFNRRVYE